MSHQAGSIFWFTGLSGAGKTTLAKGLERVFLNKEIPLKVLDGDEVRAFFENDLGYSEKERTLNVKRIAFAAKLASEVGSHVIVANIAPYAEVREFIRRKVPGYVEIYVKASVDEVAKRDVKGHYKAHKEGRMDQLVGVDDRYDIPTSPDLVIDTEQESVEESLVKICDFISQKELASL